MSKLKRFMIRGGMSVVMKYMNFSDNSYVRR